MRLPVNLVFSVNDHKQERRYLSFSSDRKLLRFGAEDGVLSATTKFAIQPASASNGLIHIRSCHDNHYWVRHSVSEPWLSTSAPEAVEDESRDNCTLFRPEISSDANFARLKHVRSGLDVVMRPAGDANAYTLCVEQSSPATLFRCIDYASLVKLDKYVVIQGDNFLFLLVRTIGNKPFLRFQSSGPINNDEFGFETFVTRNGNFRIKSMVSGKFWCLEQPSDTSPSSSWILADYAAESDPTNQNTLFEGKLIIAQPTYAKYSMRCLGNNHFCKRYTSGIHISCLAAETKSPEDRTTHIQFSSFGRSRNVTVKNFRHPRVYNTETHELVNNQVLENTNDLPLLAYIRKDGHIHTTKQRFDNGIEHSSYGQTNFVSPIPFLTVDGQVAIPQEAESSAKIWRFTYDFSSPKDVVMSYELPPRTRVTASLIALTATCEVPFSYQVDDQFFGNNGSATRNLDDGVFTGIYTYATPVRIDLVEPLPRPRQEDSDEQVKHGSD